jgi:hypothetical protein
MSCNLAFEPLFICNNLYNKTWIKSTKCKKLAHLRGFLSRSTMRANCQLALIAVVKFPKARESGINYELKISVSACDI